MNRRWSLAIAALGTFLLSSCTDSSPTGEPPGPSTTSGTPTLAVSPPPAPPQHNLGRQEVKADPCVKIDDATISRAGFDPATRKRHDMIYDTYAFIGCGFDDKKQIDGQSVTARSLTVWSTNITLDEFRSREANSATEVKIGNNTALEYEKPNEGACYVATRDSDGVLNIRIGTNLPFTIEQPCDRMIEVAEMVSSAMQ
ncbi:DUF3558 domain-containing protein [Nocardia brasiliensis]|uniref:DUF3558 domain-containing protein n=1 Tax=Nocardia brasiliensis TaxID=37326 RepID=UPI00245457A5|nr:DUF3558 domain-containing protein [Nocardia brasiliensis]